MSILLDKHITGRCKNPGRYALGFTLAEMLIAMLVASVIIVGLNACYSQAYNVFESAQQPRMAYQAARDISETLRNELAGVYAPDAGKSQDPNAQSNDPAQQHNVGAFSLIMTGQGYTELSFLTVNPCWRTGLAMSRPARVTYTLIEDKQTHTTVLKRKQQLCAGNKPLALEREDIVFAGFKQFKIQAADSQSSDDITWKNNFSAKNKLPKALKIQMKWPGETEGHDIDFEMVLGIVCSVRKPGNSK